MIRKIQPIPFFWVFACMLYTRKNDAEFTTAFNMIPWVYFYRVSSIRRKKQKQNQMTLKLHCSECCPVGFVDVVVAAGQCSHPRLKEPPCFSRCFRLIINAISTRVTLACLAVVIRYVYMHERVRTLHSYRKVLNYCRANVAKVWCLITVCSPCSKIEKKLPLYLERQHSVQL